MGIFIMRRLLQAIPVLLFSTILVVLMIHLIPGDAAGGIGAATAAMRIPDARDGSAAGMRM